MDTLKQSSYHGIAIEIFKILQQGGQTCQNDVSIDVAISSVFFANACFRRVYMFLNLGTQLHLTSKIVKQILQMRKQTKSYRYSDEEEWN